MTSFDGSGALGMLGQNPVPQGTPDELRKEGVDPGKVASCAPRSPGVRGCSVEGDCLFHQQRYGGFKLLGPKNVGYYLRTHEGNQKEDYMPCHAFVRAMVGRMRAGNAAREEGKPHEVIRIIAQEGEMIRQRVGVPVNPNDHTINARYQMRSEDVMVPFHPRPGDNTQTDYDSDLWRREQERRKSDPEFQVGMSRPFAVPEDLDDSTLDFGSGAASVVAEPVKGAKGK